MRKLFFEIIFRYFPLNYQGMFQKDVANLEPLEGPVDFAHQFVGMSNYSVEIQDPVEGQKTVQNKSSINMYSPDKNFSIVRYLGAIMQAGFRLRICSWVCGRSWSL